ncbi:MAG: T9SS type A sorting domain-containing protein, partial [Flavobacteriaceae bacterium]|nr:T9SS type A sorting domain-containing protein [Flavobacteriaceae bacterium]
FEMKVAALDAGFPAETFAVYVYDEAGDPNFDTRIYETTLTTGGDDSATDISAEIPNTFAGKQIAIIVRHYNTTGQNQLLVDDFSVTSDDTLSIDNVLLDSISIHPNPTQGIITINTTFPLDSVIIYNQLGQKAMSVTSNNLSDNKIDLRSLTNGFYLMKIQAEGKQKTIKFIKKN